MFKFSSSKSDKSESKDGKLSDRSVSSVDSLSDNFTSVEVSPKFNDQREATTSSQSIGTNNNNRQSEDGRSDQIGTVRFRNASDYSKPEPFNVSNLPGYVTKAMFDQQMSYYSGLISDLAKRLGAAEAQIVALQTKTNIVEKQSYHQMQSDSAVNDSDGWRKFTYDDIEIQDGTRNYRRYFEPNVVEGKKTDQQISSYLQQYCAVLPPLAVKLSKVIAGKEDYITFHPEREFNDENRAKQVLYMLLTTLPYAGFNLTVHEITGLVKITRSLKK